jgi:hypothetical protein
MCNAGPGSRLIQKSCDNSAMDETVKAATSFWNNASGGAAHFNAPEAQSQAMGVIGGTSETTPGPLSKNLTVHCP